MKLNEYLSTLQANNWSISKGSMTEGRLVITYHVPNGGQDTHTEQPGAEISGDNYYYRLQSVSRTDDARDGHDVRQTWVDAFGVLDTIPCFTRRNLPSRAKSALASAGRFGHTPMLYAADLLTAAATAAAQAGFSISIPGGVPGAAKIPYTGSLETVGSVLSYVLKWVPNATTRCGGRTVQVTGGGGQYPAGTTWATARVKCSPDMKTGTLTVGSTTVDLEEVYAENAAQIEPLNWYANCGRLIAAKLTTCAEASVLQAGNTLYLTAREPGAAGNGITLSLTGVQDAATAARAYIYPGELSEAGTLTDGETILNLGEATATNAKVSIPLQYWNSISPEFGIQTSDGALVVETWWNNILTAENVQEWVDFLNSGAPYSLQGVAMASVTNNVLTLEAVGTWAGAAGNALEVISYAPSPWYYGTYPFEGGADEGGTRTLADLVQAINGSALASKATASIVAESGEQVIRLKATEAGEAGNDLNFTGNGCFGTVSSFTGGADGSGITAAITPFSGGGGSTEREEYAGLLGQQGSGGTPPEWTMTRRSVTLDENTRFPSCVVCMNPRGEVVAAFPDGASPYAPGAYIVEVPDDPRTELPAGQVGERESLETVRAAVREANRQRENAQSWMMVKGWKLPAGWRVATPGTNLKEAAGNQAAWKGFWQRFSAFAVLKGITGGVEFGQPGFFPLAAQDAYPNTDDTPAFDPSRQIGGGVLGPSIKEESNVPANYRVFTPADNVHLHIEGSFPASSKARGNVSGLRFCKGTLKAYVWTTGKVQGITAEEANTFFEGTCKVGGKMRRYTCLELKDAVFINRSRKRYQTGTNRNAPGDPDYNQDRDGGRSWYAGAYEEEEPQADPELTSADYIEAAREYWAACQAAGGNGESTDISLARVKGFDAGMTVDDIFSALQLATPQGSINYDAGSRTLEVTASTGTRDVLGLEDLLTRRKAEKEAAWADTYEKKQEETERERQDPAQPLTPTQIDEAAAKTSYPMVSPSIHASNGIGKTGIPLNPFQIYAEGGKWYMNEGIIASPAGPLVFETQDITDKWYPKRAFFVKPYYNRSTRQYEAKLYYKDRS